MFFAEEKNATVLRDFINTAQSTNITDEHRKLRLDLSRQIIGYIHKEPESWDNRCTFNIKHVGEQFLQWLRDVDFSKMRDIDHIYSMSYRFLCEFDFLVGPDRELSMELRHIREKIQEDVAEMADNVRSQIIYASFVMPANIAKEFINDANIGVFKDFEQKKQEAVTLKEQWDKEIESKKIESNRLKEKLDEYKIAFNFVGLYKGFLELTGKKSKEALWLFRSLIIMGFFILAPLVGEIILTSQGFYKELSTDIDRLMVFLPILSLEIILIYFFRVILLNYRSVKAQVMQIELRQTLCQFIQSYADYSAKIKKQDGMALEKFESLIFSGILSDPEKLPSTFDGVEQLGNFIKSMKGS